MTVHVLVAFALVGLMMAAVAHGDAGEKPASKFKPLPINVASESGTEVLKWKDGKRGVFLLAFDDACPTHLTNVAPELIKREIPGTFYVITDSGLFRDKPQWTELAKSPYIVLGNHTSTHKGAETVEIFEEQVVDASKSINARLPDLDPNRLISYGKPGGVKWGITDADMQPILLKHNLVKRPPFWGAVVHVKTIDDMNKEVDTAITKGEMRHLDFHGVGGDWLPTPMDYFLATLDRLEADRDVLWLTDAVSYHKYLTERKSAKVSVLKSDDKQIRLTLTTDADPKLYDLPLTLATKVPSGWESVTVKQGDRTQAVIAHGGVVVYDAIRGDNEIILTPS